MCGICGVWNYGGNGHVARDLVIGMRDRMRHRGPDDEGLYLGGDGLVGLGFRRLSIIDLSPAGHQPMGNEDGSVQIVFNGEIYNFVDLRPALEANGHVFRSRSDTEVIVHLYEERGSDAVDALEGMFGLAIWDGRRRSLTLARDRLGKKPLYYFDDGSRILFASELKAILVDRSVPRDLDPDAVAQYLSVGYVGGDRTIFRGIKKLPPGHLLVRDANNLTVRRYWDWLPAFRAAPARSEEEWTELVRAELDRAVRARLLSDVPLGAFLSGGLDSTAVVASMASVSDRPVRTFSIGFAEQQFDELPYARLVAQRFGTEHHELMVEPESIEEVLPRLAEQCDEPFADSSVLPTYYVSKMAGQHVTVCLSGDGGDEVLGGYTRYATVLGERWLDAVPRPARQALFGLAASLVPAHVRGRRLATRWSKPLDGRYATSMQLFYDDQPFDVLTPALRANLTTRPEAQLTAAQAHARGVDDLSRLQLVDAVTYLPDDILVKVDRTSMLNSLEVRCPLLDHRFVELAAAVPADLRLRNGTGKYILRRVLRGRVPDEVLDRPKMGFGIPGHRWLKGDASGFLNDVLSDAAVRRRGVFRPEVVRRVLSRNLSPASNLWPQVWALLMFELWCRAYLDA